MKLKGTIIVTAFVLIIHISIFFNEFKRHFWSR